MWVLHNCIYNRWLHRSASRGTMPNETPLASGILESLRIGEPPEVNVALRHIAGLKLKRGCWYTEWLALLVWKASGRYFAGHDDNSEPFLQSAWHNIATGLDESSTMMYIEMLLRLPDTDGRRYKVAYDIIEGSKPSDRLGKYLISKLIPLVVSDSEAHRRFLPFRLITREYPSLFTDQQLDELLEVMLKVRPEMHSFYYRGRLEAIDSLIPRFTTAQWRKVRRLLNLLADPFRILSLIFLRHPTNGLKMYIDEYTVACLEVSNDRERLADDPMNTMAVLLRFHSRIDGRLLARISATVAEQLCSLRTSTEAPIGSPCCAAGVVAEIIRLDTSGRWQEPLLRAVFNSLCVDHYDEGTHDADFFDALLKVPDWPPALLREMRRKIIMGVVNIEDLETGLDMFERVCDEYPEPHDELLDTFSDIIIERLTEAPLDEYFLDLMGAIKAEPKFDDIWFDQTSRFWTRLKPAMLPYLACEDVELRNRANALLDLEI